MNGFHASSGVVSDDARPTHSIIEKEPQSFILPYRTLDSQLVFQNTHSWGCGIRLSLNNEHHVLSKIISDLLQTLPYNIDCTIILHKHRHIENILMRATPPVSLRLHEKQALYDYQYYLFFSTHCSREHVLTYRQKIEQLFKLKKLTYQCMGKASFLILIRTWLAHPPTASQWPVLIDIADRPLHTLIQADHTIYMTHPTHIQVHHQDGLQQHHQFNMINCQLKSTTISKQTDDCGFFSPTHLPYPFWFSATFRQTAINDHYQVFHNLTVCIDDSKDVQLFLSKLDSYFLQPTLIKQNIGFLSGLPFFITNGLDKMINRLGEREPLSLSEMAFLHLFDDLSSTYLCF